MVGMSNLLVFGALSEVTMNSLCKTYRRALPVVNQGTFWPTFGNFGNRILAERGLDKTRASCAIWEVSGDGGPWRLAADRNTRLSGRPA
jgi:hypothetical protein